MSTNADDNDETTPHVKLDEKYAVYRDVEGFGWMVDTGVGGTWSWNVDDAEWFNSPEDAIGALYACDIIEMGTDYTEQHFVIVRVK